MVVTKAELTALKRRFFPPAPPPPEALAALAILHASKLIERQGWIRGELCTKAGYCAVGAILAVQEDVAIQEIAFESIRAECGCPAVSKWNDEIAETKKQVLKTLAGAARRAKLAATPRTNKPHDWDRRSSIYSFA